MKKRAILFWLIQLFFLSTKALSQSQPSNKSETIRTNIAYGKATVGGMGGKVIKVTNLNSRGSGSFLKAILTKGPRIVVFEVAGVIDLNKAKVRITEPYLTIAGQTAPSPGITIIKGEIAVKAHDVIIQHLHIRPGDAGQAPKSGYEPDGLSAIGDKAYNIIIDHCSITWAVDENLSASGKRSGVDSTSHKITFSNNIIAEGLFKSSHSKGAHSMGSLVHDFVQDIIITGNLYSCNNRRNPFFKSFTRGAVVNNLIYNPGQAAIHMNWSQQELEKWAFPPENGKISIVGNVLYKGQNSKPDLALVSGKGDVYLEDNLTFGVKGEQVPMVVDQIKILNFKPSWPSDFKAMPAAKIVDYILKNVGARPKDREAIDKRIIDNFINFTGTIINSQNDVGGYPKYKPAYRKLNVPKEGIDKWLAFYTNEVE